MSSKKLKKLTPDEVWTRWNERMTRVRKELHYVFSTRKKFRDVTSMFEKTKELNAIGGDVYNWLFGMWSRDIVIAIRRELDNDTNTVCLGRLLDEMAQRSNVITRRRFLHGIPEDDFRHTMLSTTFTGHGVITTGHANIMDDYLDAAVIATDRQKLSKVSKPVIAYANQLIAHRSEKEEVKATLGDVNRSVDEIEKLFLKYYAIINGPALMGLEPSIIGDWTAPFRIPWLKPEVA